LVKEETGTVHLSFLIGVNGIVKDAKVLESSGAPLLDQAALEGVRKCRFSPATEDGIAIETWQKMQYVWTLEVPSREEEAALRRLQANDFSGAAALFRKAAEKGSADAQFYLGGMLFFGHGVKQDAAEAMAWMEKAAEHGHIKAKGALGSMLLAKGDADQRAFGLVRSAAREEDVPSMYWMGTCLEHGRGTAKDLKQAREWYRRAADSGHPKAKQALERVERSLD
jgi:TonB family protein